MNLLIYCSGGLGREVMDIARRLNQVHSRWQSIAFLDDMREERSYYGAEVFRLEAALKSFGATDVECVVANGEPSVRKTLAGKLDEAHVPMATLIGDTTVVSESATIGAGCVIFPQCYVSSMANIGRNVAIIVGSAIGHDSVLGDNCVVSGQVNIGGECIIGSETYVAMGSQIKQHTRIGRGSVVGMGSVVFSDIPDEVIALGNPCRPLRTHDRKLVFA